MTDIDEIMEALDEKALRTVSAEEREQVLKDKIRSLQGIIRDAQDLSREKAERIVELEEKLEVDEQFIEDLTQGI